MSDSPNHPEIPESSTCKQSLQVGQITPAELDALPDDTVLRATGRFATIQNWQEPIGKRHQDTGSFRDCTIRPVPLEWTNGRRLFEVLALGASRADAFMVTTADLIESARVLS